MTDSQIPQIYLATPLLTDAKEFAETLSSVLDNHPVACLRFRTASTSEVEIGGSAEILRAVCHARDIPIVIESHFLMAARLGLDGVHLPNAAKSVREARSSVGADGIVGTYCGASKHAGLNAAEMGCDYVEFGPACTPNLLGDGRHAEFELFEWWHQMIEVPVVAQGEITPDIAAEMAPVTDFLCLGDELWQHTDGPEKALGLILSRLR